MSAEVAFWSDWFWRRAGGRPGAPVDIGYAVTCALEVGIRPIAGLTTSTAIDHLRRVGFTPSDSVADERELHGCIAIGPRGGLILVEMCDGDAQRRFTIAHEVSHYILEVHRHHQRAEQRMGSRYVGVLYGSREATSTERIDAWLNNARSAPITHFMDRASDGGYVCGRSLEAECHADDLAIELLAPRAEMVRIVRDCQKLPFRDLTDAVRRIAERRFGLPDSIAERCASRVVWQMRGGPSTAERFGFGGSVYGYRGKTDSMRRTLEVRRE